MKLLPFYHGKVEVSQDPSPRSAGRETDVKKFARTTVNPQQMRESSVYPGLAHPGRNRGWNGERGDD